VRLFNHATASAIREAFGELLSEWPWVWYLTWTFRDRVGPVKAVQEIRHHTRLIEWGMGYEICWVFGLEQEYGADRPHGHGLICGGSGNARPGELYADDPHERRVLLMEPYWRAWMDRNGAGRFVRVEDERAVSFYCSKYSVKGGEIFMSDNLSRFRRSGDLRRGALPAAVTLAPVASPAA
jgi:hypothetical protein